MSAKITKKADSRVPKEFESLDRQFRKVYRILSVFVYSVLSAVILILIFLLIFG